LQAGTTVSECGHRGVCGSADRLKASPDQHRDIRIGLGDGAEDLPPTIRRLDVANANLQMAFVVMAAADERRVHRDSDRRRGDDRFGHSPLAKMPADPERMPAQRLGTLSGFHR
jgi:hypothetical protein